MHTLPAVDDHSKGAVPQKKWLQVLVKQESPRATTGETPERRGSVDKCCYRFAYEKMISIWWVLSKCCEMLFSCSNTNYTYVIYHSKCEDLRSCF